MAWSIQISKQNGKLIFKDVAGFQSRSYSTFWCIQKADEKYNWGDFSEITINTEDAERNANHYTYSKSNGFHNLVPDFNFHAWPESGVNDYEEFVNAIDKAGLQKFEINKVGWIGNIETNFRRKQLLEIGRQNNQIFDIIDMQWINTGKVFYDSTRYISTYDLAKRYSMLIDVDGFGYSGRLKHLLWSHRPILLVDRPHKEFFFEYLKEWEHYIPVKRDLSDVIEKTLWCINNYDKALQIAENAYQFSKLYLTRDACYAQWNKIITLHMNK